MFAYKTKDDWVGTSPTGVSIMLCHDVDICDQFLFVDLCDSEIHWAFAQIEAMQQIAVVDHSHVMSTLELVLMAIALGL